MAVKVKICGLSTADAVEAAVRGGAAMTGFVFFPPSPRSLDPLSAGALAARVPADVLKVGVMVDPDDDLLDRVLATVPLDVLQLHGHETPERVASVRGRTKRRVMKALRIERPADLEAAARYVAVVDYLLFDTKPPKDAVVPGGHGRTFDWQILTGLSLPRAWLLAGGIALENLDDAVRVSGARWVDVSSGVERRPGEKDVAKIEALLQHAASVRPARSPHPVEVPA